MYLKSKPCADALLPGPRRNGAEGRKVYRLSPNISLSSSSDTQACRDIDLEKGVYDHKKHQEKSKKHLNQFTQSIYIVLYFYEGIPFPACFSYEGS